MKKIIWPKTERFFRKAAAWLNRKTSELPVSRLRLLLLMFCLLFGAISAYSIFEAFIKKPPTTMRLDLLHQPLVQKHTGKKFSGPAHENSLSPEILKRIESLKSNDSLLRARPRLLDTIREIEKVYQTREKK